MYCTKQRILGLVLLGIWGCGKDGQQDHKSAFSALDTETGEHRSFASRDQIPPGWVECEDAECTALPPFVPCQNLNHSVCWRTEHCQLITTSCYVNGCSGLTEPGTPTHASGGSEPGPGAGAPPPEGQEAGASFSCPDQNEVCEYACVAKRPKRCEDHPDAESCASDQSCEWGDAICPLAPCTPDWCPPCEQGCRRRRDNPCTELGKRQCLGRPDCQWGVDLCPMIACAPETPDCAVCEPFCQPREQDPPQCPVIPRPSHCADGSLPEPDYKDGCIVGYSCKPLPDNKQCNDLKRKYAQVLQQARRCDDSLDVEQCGLTIASNLGCVGCPTFVNRDNSSALGSLRELAAAWREARCDVALACPAIACDPAPRGFCSNGLCHPDYPGQAH